MVYESDSVLPLIGASGVVSGFTGAMARFAFATGGPLGRWRAPGDDAFLYPAPPLLEFFRNQRALTFVALWFALNFVPTLFTGAFGAGDEPIAWMAHIGGFLAGFLLFGLFDPIGRLPRGTVD
jgi:membrane associated rhomboid family serine protease